MTATAIDAGPPRLGTIDLPHFISRATEESYSELVSELQRACLGEDGGRHRAYDVDLGDGPVRMAAGRLLANLALFYPYRLAPDVRPPMRRAVVGPLDARSLEAHMDATIAELYDVVDPGDLSRASATSAAFLADLGSSVTARVGTSVSIKALFEAAEAQPRVWELLNWSAPPGSLGEIEAAADAAGAELAGILSSLPGEYGRLLRSGAAINRDQLRQALVSVGVKPGLSDGELIPEPIDVSFLRGMRNAQDMYICAIGARKALATNFRQVKNSGYLARKLVLLVNGHTIDKELADCRTQRGVEFVVQGEAHADRLEGRWIRMHGDQNFRLRSCAELAGMVGQRGTLRSPATCAGPGGTCHACYGLLARANVSVHAGVLGTLVISEQITQRLLSSKHLLKARPTPVAWPAEFLEHFTVERAAVIPESQVEKITVFAEDVEYEEEDEGAERQKTAVFWYKAAGRQKAVRMTLTVPIYLDEEAWEGAEESEGERSISPVPEMAAFHVPVANTDLSEALYAIYALIEREENTSLHELYGRLLELLIKSSIEAPSVHAEMIIRALVRSEGDPTARPDFSGPEEPPYQILKLPAAILNSASVTNSLSFERVKAQLTSVEILEKDGAGMMDALFGG
jgi:hypothetical protein